MRYGKILAICGITLLLLAILSSALYPAGTSKKKRQQIARGQTVRALGEQIVHYIEKHGHKPVRLAEIVPSPSNTLSDATLFIIPGKRREAEERFKLSSAVFRYEDYSDYILDTNQNSEILIYEKPGVRGDDTVYYYGRISVIEPAS